MRGFDSPTVAEFSALVGEISDAALDPSSWPYVLTRIAEFTGGHGAALGAKQNNGGSDIYFQDGCIPQPYFESYLAKYTAIDPCAAAYFMAKPGQIVATCDVMDYKQFQESRTYKEWIRPQDLVDGAAAILDNNKTSITLAVVFRHARHGLADDELRARLALLVPHLRRSASVMRLIESNTARTAALHETLDALRAAVFFVDAKARLCQANASGQAMLEDGDVLRNVDGRLATQQRVSTQAFEDKCAAAALIGPAGANGTSVSFVSRNGVAHVAHVLPLASGARQRIGCDRTMVAAVFVQRDASLSPSALQAMAEAYALTAGELRVLLAIAAGGGVANVADALGLSEATVRTHLHRLFAKTGTSRQSDLVRLIARFVSPLVR